MDGLILSGLAVAAWIVARLVVRRRLLRRGTSPRWRRPLTCRPWPAAIVLAFVVLLAARTAWRRHAVVDALELPDTWNLQRRRFWTDSLAAGGVDLHFRVAVPRSVVDAQVREWLERRGPWTASLDMDDSGLRAGQRPWEPALRHGLASETAWRVDDWHRERRPFSLHFRRLGDPSDELHGITACVIEAGPQETWIDAWVYHEYDL